DAHGAASGEEIQHPLSLEKLAEDVEDRLAHAIGGRADRTARRREDLSSSRLPRDDPQRAHLPSTSPKFPGELPPRARRVKSQWTFPGNPVMQNGTMRRRILPLILPVALVVACSKSEPPAASKAPAAQKKA